jgi:low temperature requirement protein LtrA
VIAHPGEHLHTAELLVVAGGPALYLLALTLFRLRMAGTVAWKRLGAAVACLVAAPLGAVAPALVLGWVVFAILVAVIAAEERAGARRAARGELSPLERLNAEAESSAAASA